MREYVAIVVLDLNLTTWLLAHAIGALPHLGAEDDSIEPLLVIRPEYLHLGACWVRVRWFNNRRVLKDGLEPGDDTLSDALFGSRLRA